MADYPMNESMILEEEIDENYEPTQDEIKEYAKFLGMDLIADKDLFWIAKEGLKAPLPEPWKPCQSRTGEIYYMNLQTGQHKFEHPCDEYYKDIYAKEKAKKQTRRAASANQSKQQTQTTTPSNVFGGSKDSALLRDNTPFGKVGGGGIKPLAPAGLGAGFIDDFSTIGSLNKFKKPLGDIPSVLGKGKEDPLLKIERDKKLKTFEQSKQKEMEEKQKEIDSYIAGRKKLIEENYQSKLAQLKTKVNEDGEKEKKETMELIKKYENEEEDNWEDSSSTFLEQFREEQKVSNKEKLKKLNDDLEMKMIELRNDLREKYQKKLQEQKTTLMEDGEREIQVLEEEIQELEQKSRATSTSDGKLGAEREKEELDRLRALMRKEVEEKYNEKIAAMKYKIKNNTNDIKNRDLEIFNTQMNSLGEMYEAESKSVENFDESAFEEKLTKQYNNKMEELKREMSRRLDKEKLAISSKMNEREKALDLKMRQKLEDERNIQLQLWNQQKSEMIRQINEEKKKVDDEVTRKLAEYKKSMEKEIQSETKRLTEENDTRMDRIKEWIKNDTEENDQVVKTMKQEYENLNKNLLRANADIQNINNGLQVAMLKNKSLKEELAYLLDSRNGTGGNDRRDNSMERKSTKKSKRPPSSDYYNLAQL